MNQPDQGSLKLMRPSISHPNVEEQRLLKTMHYAPDRDQMVNTILQMTLKNSDGVKILSDLAATIGDWLAADLCIVISGSADLDRVNEVAYWQQSAEKLSEDTLQQLRHLPINGDVNPSTWLESSSPYFQEIKLLVSSIDPNKSWQGIKTQFQENTNGLVLLLKSPGEEWGDVQEQIPSQVVNCVAIAISQAQLQQQSRTKSRYQSLLENLSREISQGYRPQVLFQNCLGEIGHTLQLDRCMILMFKYQNPLRAKDRDRDLVEGTTKVTYQWSADPESSLSSTPSFSLNNSQLCQKAWRHAPDCLYLDSDGSFPDLTVDSLSSRGSALLMVPLMGKKTSKTDSAMVLGFLVLQSDASHSWSRDELELMGWVGVQISTAIIHDQTLNRVHLIVDERTAQLKSSMDMQGKLSAKMRQHIEQLQKLNQLKDDFMNSMSHELKTPLTSMKIAIKMLRQEQISPAMRERYLDILEQEWHREYNLIKDLLTLQQVESGELDYHSQELDLSETIKDLSQCFETKWQSDRDISLVCTISPPDLKIQTDIDSFKNILHELLSNAGKYSHPHTKIELSVSRQVTAKQEEIVISVANMGAGITPEELPHIFEKFRRGKGVTDRAVPGTGLGLTLLQYFVEHLKGTIEVTSQPSDDDEATFLTIFLLKLPQIQPSIS